MSRGYGTYQRRVVDALVSDAETLKRGLPLNALRPALPRDRSNRRRVVLSLIRRGDVEKVTDEETGEQQLRLTFIAGCAAWMRKRDAEAGYDGQDKFGWPEDSPQTFFLEDGTEVEEEEFLNVLRKEARRRGITS